VLIFKCLQFFNLAFCPWEPSYYARNQAKRVHGNQATTRKCVHSNILRCSWRTLTCSNAEDGVYICSLPHLLDLNTCYSSILNKYEREMKGFSQNGVETYDTVEKISTNPMSACTALVHRTTIQRFPTPFHR